MSNRNTRRRRKMKKKRNIKVTIAENFPKLMAEMKSQIQEEQSTKQDNFKKFHIQTYYNQTAKANEQANKTKQ